MPRVIPLEELTVDDLVNLGPRAVTEHLPKSLLLTIARLYVTERLHARQRAASLSAERRAYRAATGSDEDSLQAMVQAAAMEAAARITFDWTPLLDIPFLVPSAKRTVTWGLADADEHRDRAQWLERQAAGNVRTAVQHRAAIDDLAKHGADRLLQIVGRP